MSYQALQDAIHAAMAKIKPPDTPPTVALTECHDCWGTNPCCPTCHGCGWWRG